MTKKLSILFFLIVTVIFTLSGCSLPSQNATNELFDDESVAIEENNNIDTSMVNGEEILSLVSSESTIAVIKSDQSLWMWGQNSSGQIGNGSKDNTPSPVKILDDVIFVSVGRDNSAAIKSDNTLWVWGSNQYGQLGEIELGNDQAEKGYNIQTKPLKIMDDVSDVYVGECNMAAIGCDNSLWTWGSNYYGQIGNGVADPFQPPTKVMDGVKCCEFGDGNAIAIKLDGSLWTWGSNMSGTLGNGSNGKIGDYQTTPIKILDNISTVSNAGFWGFQNTLAISYDNELYSWGANQYGQVGLKNESNGLDAWERPAQTIPAKILSNVAKISSTRVYNMNYSVMCAITKDNCLYTWGLNDNGQIGNGKKENVSLPAQIMDNVDDAFVCGTIAVALTKDGNVWIWGTLTSGDEPLLSPQKISEQAKAIYPARTRDVFIIKNDGLLYKYNEQLKETERVFS